MLVTGNFAVIQLSHFLQMRENMVVKWLWRLFNLLLTLLKIMNVICILILLR